MSGVPFALCTLATTRMVSMSATFLLLILLASAGA